MAEQATHGFTRRSFIKGAAALTATGALVGCSPQTQNLEKAEPQKEVPETQIFSGVCRGNCFGGCFLNVHVRDGQMVRTTARDMIDGSYNRICSKGLSHMGRVYSANRIQYPMKRVGERGEGKFERISWDEAVNIIAEKWKGYAEEFGPESVSLISQSGNLSFGGGVFGIGSYLSRFASIMGMSRVNGNLDWALQTALIIGFGGQANFGSSNEPTDFKNASTIICWGSNPAVSQLHNMHFILEAKEQGTKFIVIDPVYNMTAAKADQYIPIKATTDAALAMGIINEIFANGWEDVDFLCDHTEAALLIKEDGSLLKMSDLGVEAAKGEPDPTTGEPTIIDPYVVWDEDANKAVVLDEAKKPAMTGVADVNGIAVKTTLDNLKATAAEYTPEKVEEMTGVPAATVKELAEVYTQNGPVTTYTHYGMDHYDNGHYAIWSVLALGMVSGNIGKKGASTGPTGMNVGGFTNIACSFAAADSKGNPCLGSTRSYNLDLMNDVLDTGEYNGEKITVKSLYITLANPVSVYAQQGYIEEAFSKIDFIVVADQSMTDTAKWADILLPAADWYEQSDMYAACGTQPYLVWADKAMEPLYESKSDFDIYKMIVEKMGYGEFWGWKTNEDALAEVLDSDALREMGITFDKLKEEKVMRILPGDPYRPYEGGAFNTPTARGRFYQETPFADTVGQEVDVEKERVPHHEPSLEADEVSVVRKDHPFHLLSDHMRTRTHTQWWDVEVLSEVETTPVVKMNPEDAAELGIAAGDQVKVYNDRGFCILEAVLNAGLPRKTASVPRGFQRSEFIDGHLASLPIMKFNQTCANQPFNDVAVAIEKM